MSLKQRRSPAIDSCCRCYVRRCSIRLIVGASSRRYRGRQWYRQRPHRSRSWSFLSGLKQRLNRLFVCASITPAKSFTCPFAEEAEHSTGLETCVGERKTEQANRQRKTLEIVFINIACAESVMNTGRYFMYLRGRFGGHDTINVRYASACRSIYMVLVAWPAPTS